MPIRLHRLLNPSAIATDTAFVELHNLCTRFPNKQPSSWTPLSRCLGDLHVPGPGGGDQGTTKRNQCIDRVLRHAQ